MTAFLIASMVVQNVGWLADYVATVPLIVRRHGGTYIGVSKSPPDAIELVEGVMSPPDVFAILAFPSADAAKAFLADPEYAACRAKRRAGTESNFWLFENNDEAPQFVGQRDILPVLAGTQT